MAGLRARHFFALMPEMAHAGEHHRKAALIGGGDHLIIAH